MKKIIVTGASGLIGRHTLIPLLERGFEVYATCMNVDGSLLYPNLGIHWFRVNLLDPKSVEGLIENIKPEYLLHLAWDIKGNYRDATTNIEWMNTSLYLMYQFAKYGKRAVLSGTCFEYDPTKFMSEEKGELKPDTLYGICKNSLFNILNYSNFGFSWAWARPFYLYGPHETVNRLIPSIIRGLLTEGGIGFDHDGHQQIDYLYVQDVADAFITLLESDVTGAFNINSGKVIAIRRLAARITDLLDMPSAAVKFGNKQLFPESIYGGEGRLRHELHWSPKVSLERGLAKTINWWKSQLVKIEPVPVDKNKVLAELSQDEKLELYKKLHQEGCRLRR